MKNNIMYEIEDVKYKKSWRDLPRWRRGFLYRIEEIMVYLNKYCIVKINDLVEHFKSNKVAIRNHIGDSCFISIEDSEVSLTNEGKRYIKKLIKGLQYKPTYKNCYVGKLSFKEFWDQIYNVEYRPSIEVKFQKKGDTYFVNDFTKRTPNLIELGEICARDSFEIIPAREIATFMKVHDIDKEIEKKCELLRFRERWVKGVRRNTCFNVKSFPTAWIDLKYTFELFSVNDFHTKYGIAKTNVRERLNLGNIKLRDKTVRIKKNYKNNN